MRATIASCTSLCGALVAATAVLMWPAAAQAQEPAWSACNGLAGYTCATVTVPLDRSAPSQGSVRLSVSRVTAASNPDKIAVVPLAGGPGQAALPLRQSFAGALSAALATRDLLVFDQRGTGSSDPLACGALRSAATLVAAEQGCASELGSARGFYRTIDSVADIEALRIAGGYEKLMLFGVSYGTKVAQAYAAAHPDRVEALILDSVVPVDGPDPFRLSSLRAVPRVLKQLCASGACARATPDVAADLRAVASRLARRPVSGRVTTSSGRQRTETMSESALIGALLSGDLNPALRAELPGSLRAARRGDWRPLLRLASRARTTAAAGYQTTDRTDSTVLFLATTCEELPFGWTRSAGPRQRWTEIGQAAARVPASARGPFSASATLESSSAILCVAWPTAGEAPPATEPLPDVPTLVIAGQMDLRTPVEDAELLRSALPRARFVRVPFTGHSALSSDASTCAADALAAFLAAAPETSCAGVTNRYAPTPRPPASLASVRRSAGVKGRPGRVVAAAIATVTDARRQVIGEALTQNQIPSRVGGLRSGTVSARVSGDEIALTLRRYVYVPGVVVSGRFVTGRGGTVTVRGRGISGQLRITASGAANGTIGGRRVRTGSAASAGRSLPTLAEIRATMRRW
ncbi:MAG: alpha/beta hydrolase [Baekduia sp.]